MRCVEGEELDGTADWLVVLCVCLDSWNQHIFGQTGNALQGSLYAAGNNNGTETQAQQILGILRETKQNMKRKEI